MRTHALLVSASALAASLAVAATARADSVADFYSGRTITVYVPVAAGGIYSTYAQMMAPHFSKHIPGNPTVIVKHMPGAGGISAMNFVYNAAPQDGTALITPLTGLSKDQAFHQGNVKYDARKYQWLGGWGEAVTVCSVWKTAPATTIEEARQKVDVMGAFSKSSNTYRNPEAVNQILGTKFKIVVGYGGGSKVRLAMEKHELDGWCGQYLGWKMVKPEWLQKGLLAHLVQLASKRSPDMPNVPLLSEFAKTPDEKAILEFIEAGLDDRGMAAPPGVPADRVAALEKAYQETLHDPAFLADAKKLHMDIDPLTGKQIQDFVAKIMSLSPANIERAQKAMGMM
jgi:tripartite-type tricarboxylate transporter receptor subunit TctC